jgi:hypothetical protein
MREVQTRIGPVLEALRQTLLLEHKLYKIELQQPGWVRRLNLSEQ